MCFFLYAATDKPLPRSEWSMNDPHVHVRDLRETELWARSIFSKCSLQYIGSTSSCGCAFPSVMQDKAGDWPYWLDPIKDAEVIASDQRECEELCQLLAQIDDDEVELCGVWAGNEEEGPAIREEISLAEIRRELFRFKEGGFYRGRLR